MGLNYSRRYGESGGLTVGGSLSDANWYNEMSTANYERSRIDATRRSELEVVGAHDETYHPELVTARNALLSALHDAKAYQTGLRVACLLQTQDGVYHGSNQEPGRYEKPFKFRHAETAALAKMMQESESETIDRVIMAGFGQRKIKQVSPCFNCYDMLSGVFGEHTELILFEPTKLNRAVILDSDEHTAAYTRKQPLAIESTEHEAIKAELREKAALVDGDIELMARIRQLGIENDIAFYLTGSASGRGWVSDPIRKKTGEPPRDLDVIAVTDMPADKVARLITPNSVTYNFMFNRTFSTREWYPAKAGNSLSSHHAFLGSPRQHAHSYSKEGEQTPLEITVVPELSLGMLDPGYFKRNFYLKVS